jgi:hypothetical protein
VVPLSTNWLRAVRTCREARERVEGRHHLRVPRPVLGGRNQEQTAARRLHVWIASFNAIVALALTGPLLLLLVLDWFPDEHASLANRGFPLFLLWAGVQAVAVLLAEATARLFFWWLEPHAP